MSDALESLVNLAAGLVALGALTYAHRPADDKHHFGHDKAEYFASGVEGALILVAAAVDHLVGGPAPARARSRSRTSARASSSRSSPAGMNFATARIMLKVAEAARQHHASRPTPSIC